MARPREFDRNKVLRKAMDLFWKQGYEATSVQDLGDHLGLKPGSLYNTFKDKHSLFLEALDCYQTIEAEQACKLLRGPEGGIAAIRQLFTGITESDLHDPDRKGCMMVNAAAELAAHDPEVRARVAASRAVLATVFREAIIQAQQAGDIPASRDPDGLATYLVNSLFGLRITAKVTNDRSVLMNIVDTTLRALN